ncbi:MAG: hypothetical protein M1825_003908 [Sarcosagium campestre]|nr:MAG: hypothetical protein M1825_003908 [Sarcosagium campestre]
MAVAVDLGSSRQFQSDLRRFPKRRKVGEAADLHKLEPLSVDRLIAGIWKQLYSELQLQLSPLIQEGCLVDRQVAFNRNAFQAVNALCLKVSQLSRCSRSLEIVVQAFWVGCFDERSGAIANETPSASSRKTKMLALREACAVLGCSEKELRNKVGIWRGYKEIKDAGGWASLVFAGNGVYRFCKYRVGFGKDLISKLRRMRSCFQVAADTLHPEWRELLAIVGQDSSRSYNGHPHDWVVSTAFEPVTLASTYSKWDQNFTYRHLTESIIDRDVWGAEDPRKLHGSDSACCRDCGLLQYEDIRLNHCKCFPELYGGAKLPPPVQIFHTTDGRNNGVIARSLFARGAAVGEFVGLITKGIRGIDVMQGGIGDKQYQVFQGRMGNHTRFINHSCNPNSQFQKFIWLGIERIVVVSRGIETGAEITVDYSNQYWDNLDKVCLCGEPCCRYRRVGQR